MNHMMTSNSNASRDVHPIVKTSRAKSLLKQGQMVGLEGPKCNVWK